MRERIARPWLQIRESYQANKYFIFSRISILFFHENICCGYSLEAPRRGASNEYHNICFRGEIRKITIILVEKSALSKLKRNNSSFWLKKSAFSVWSYIDRTDRKRRLV